ncbi:MAG TPA: hypothetical protein VGF95_05275 [Solirubrobacteraceae bacterium]|jgi:hypothetical protein
MQPSPDHAQDAVVVEVGPQLRLMCAEILSPERTYPVLGLSCRTGEREPLLPAERVRELIGPGIPIYVIQSRLTRALERMLPERHSVHSGAARIWWPSVSEDSNPDDHPLIRVHQYDKDARRALERVARELQLRTPLTELQLPPEQLLLLAERRREQAEQRARQLEAELQTIRKKLTDAREQAIDAAIGPRRPASGPNAGTDPRCDDLVQP